MTDNRQRDLERQRLGRDLYVSLQDHFNSKLQAVETRYMERLEGMDKAIEVAWTNAEKWRQNANEWRSAMDDREESFATKPMMATVAKDLDEVKGRLDRMEGKSMGLSAAWGIIVLVAMLVLSAIQIYLKT